MTGDTVIRTTEGDHSLAYLSERHKPFKVYQYDTRTHKVTKSEDTTAVQTKLTDTLVKLDLEDGTSVRCTPDHKFLIRSNSDYTYVEAKDLTEDMDIVTI